ncbi:hypothetical protein FDP41_012793 [Naegleria fowleri]|uniref:F-box domain-containing protein n=1 Tax=Naegleria fowleri TaxID=5763 RepID=A0A6A5C6A4_NAEFO|nr:uncharacterized protein FDP41_012793 [Naegleria fowleri]KAF0981005.1 hypothetical protein FDP41_012793 [Naegleria fowleri]CAG4717756.1 unnamed protein product [Naegleria fowleri]
MLPITANATTTITSTTPLNVIISNHHVALRSESREVPPNHRRRHQHHRNDSSKHSESSSSSFRGGVHDATNSNVHPNIRKHRKQHSLHTPKTSSSQKKNTTSDSTRVLDDYSEHFSLISKTCNQVVPIREMIRLHSNASFMTLSKDSNLTLYSKEISKIYTLSDLPGELVIQILMFLTSHESASILLTCSSICENLLKENGFYKLLYIQWISRDLLQCKNHLEQRQVYNHTKCKYDCRQTYFNALGVSQWKQVIQKKEMELRKHLNRKGSSIHWKKIFHGYYLRSQYEKIRFKLASISKLCYNNPNALVLVSKLFQYLKTTLQNLPSDTERDYVIKRNYGKQIKRNHTLVHQCFYLLGNFSDLKTRKEELDRFIPFLNYFLYSSRNVVENPLTVKNSWNLTAFHYAIRVGSNYLLRELSTTFFGNLKACTLLRLTEEPQKAPILYHLVKYNIYPIVFQEWIRINLCKPELFLSKAREGSKSILHYMMLHGMTHPRTVIGYLSLIKEVFSPSQITQLLNEKDQNGETPFGYAIATISEKFSTQSNFEFDFGKIFGILNYLTVDLHYSPSQQELDRWNQCLDFYRMTHVHSRASQVLSKYRIDRDSIQLRRLMQKND